MGLKKTIYIPSKEIWDTIVSESERKGVSVSDFLVAGFKREPQLDRIEGLLQDIYKSVNIPRKLLGKDVVGPEPSVLPGPKYVPSYSDGNIKTIPKELPKKEKVEALKAAFDYFLPDPKKGKK